MIPLKNTQFWKKEILTIRFRQMQGGELVSLLDDDLTNVDPDILDAVRHRILMLALPSLRYWSAKARSVPAEDVLSECATTLLAYLGDRNSPKFSVLIIDFYDTGLKAVARVAEYRVKRQAGFRRLPDTRTGPKPYRPMRRREVSWDPGPLQDLIDEQQGAPPEADGRLEKLSRLDEATKGRFAQAIRAVEALETQQMGVGGVAVGIGVSKRTVRRRLQEFAAFLEGGRGPKKNAAE